MWTPSDLLTDADLLALDRQCLTDFQANDATDLLADKRAVACAWARVRVEQAGYRPWLHRTRKAPDAVYGGTTDYTAAAQSTTESDVPLSSILANPSAGVLYVGYRDPFAGLAVDITDNVNALAGTLTVATWQGAWRGVSSLADGTAATAGTPFGAGGALRWAPVDGWTRRTLNNSLLYWAKVTMSSSLTAGTAAAQIAPIVPSRLALPCAYYALGLLYQESFGSQRGQWQEKADRFLTHAKEALDLVLPQIADEFDADDTGTVDRTEVSSILPDIGALTTWERG